LRRLISRFGRGLFMVGVCWGVAFSVQSAAYEVELEAPEALRRLLEENLALYRWREEASPGADSLRHLERTVPAEIQALLETEGYYAATVQVELDGGRQPPLFRLVLTPGEPVRVAQYSLTLQGAVQEDPEARERLLTALDAAWPLKAGARFRHAAWESAKRAALVTLLADRYPRAQIAASRATVDPVAGTVRLELTLESGPAYRFGELEVEGLTRYPRHVVERLNPIRPDEPYAQSRLLDFQNRLRDSPYFVAATVSADPDSARDGRIPVRVTVQERHAKRIGLGVGMSTDAGPRGSLEYRDLHLLERAWRLSASLVADGRRQTLAGRLELPQSAQGYRDSFNGRLERTDIANLVTRTYTLGAQRARRRGRHDTVLALDFARERQEAAGTATTKLQALTGSHTWLLREVDDLLFPTSGYLLSLQVGGGARALLSDRDFLRGHGRIAWFRPVGRQGSLILRGELGAIWSGGREGIPNDLLFRTGGDQSVRGYGYQTLGVAQGGAVVGGRYLAVASAEYVHWLQPKWGLALFLDAGDAADDPGELDLKRGYGLGLRWKSPVGPLSLDAAHGEAAGGVRLHFSVSLSF
jgi:translocation and assembly module TamA